MTSLTEMMSSKSDSQFYLSVFFGLHSQTYTGHCHGFIRSGVYLFVQMTDNFILTCRPIDLFMLYTITSMENILLF